MNAHASILREFGLTAEFAAEATPQPSEGQVEMMLARARGQARADGYARGIEDAEAGFDREVLLRLDEVNAALGELVSCQAKQEAALADACRKILVTFLDAVSPRLAGINALPEIITAVEDAVRATPGAQIRIEAPPALAACIAAHREQLAANCEIVPTPELDGAEARVIWDDGFDHIDMRPAIEAALTILDAHLRPALPDQPVNVSPAGEVDAPESNITVQTQSQAEETPS